MVILMCPESCLSDKWFFGGFGPLNGTPLKNCKQALTKSTKTQPKQKHSCYKFNKIDLNLLLSLTRALSQF